MGICFSLAFLRYVFSMLNTSIASTLFLLSMSPIFAGCIGWFWINEKTPQSSLDIHAIGFNWSCNYDQGWTC